MSRRRDDLKALFAGEPVRGEPVRGEPVGSESVKPEPAPEQKALIPSFLRGEPPTRNEQLATPPRAASGALKAMGLELDGLRQAAGEVERLKSQLASSAAVVDIEPGLIDAAFVRDRMAGDVEADGLLEASIAANGQQVPVLLRPHPRDPGRYESVYGHRRVAALKRLGKPVRAIVRALSDDELVIAQGQENNQRRDLSFIERARFAAVLESRGFPRSTIMAALDAHKSDLTRYIAITGAVPLALIDAIGPAPATGRPRWMALADVMPQGGTMSAQVKTLLSSAAFQALPSDARFKAVFGLLKGGKIPAALPSPAALSWRSADGDVSVDLKLSGSRGAAFAEFLGKQMDRLHAEFRNEQNKPVEQWKP